MTPNEYYDPDEGTGPQPVETDPLADGPFPYFLPGRHEPDRIDSHGHHQKDTQQQPAAICGTDGKGSATGANAMAEGNILPAGPVEPPTDDPVSRAKALSASVMNRLKAEGKWFGLIALERDRMMSESKAAIPDITQRQLWVYGELDRMYPPAESTTRVVNSESESTTRVRFSEADSGQIQGLSDLPEDWPTLPANAALGSEIGWVQANRLRIVTEKPGGATVVRLDQALGPAPSWAALGWLETSIRSYAKFVDVAAKVSGGAEDEGAVMRRERKSIDEVRALLDEMKLADGVCSRCGRSG
jgi:hypothetical protein